MRKILIFAFAAVMLAAWMQHLAIHTQEQPGATNEWLEPVSDEQYNKLIAF